MRASRPKIVRSALCLLGTAALAAGTARANDPGKYLIDPRIEIVRENGRAQVFPGGTDEKYYAKDGYGNLFKLRAKDALPGYSEIGVSLVNQAIGAPTIPVYPILLKRGRKGLPTADEAKGLAPDNYRFGLSGARGEWFPGTLQPVGRFAVYDAKNLRPTQIAELTMTLALSWVFGNHDVQFGDGVDGNITFALDGNGDGHFISPDATQSFKFYPETANSPDLLRKFLDQARVSRFRSAFESRGFQDTLNTFVSRLEKIPEADLLRVFGAYFASVASLRAHKGLPPFDYAAELVRRIRGLRGGLAAAGIPLRDPPRRVPTPKIRVPRILRHAGATVVPDLAKLQPSEALWDFYFQDFWKARGEYAEKWGTELGGDAVEELIRRGSAGDAKLHFVGPDLEVDPRFEAYRPQLTLPPRNRQTLVVVPVNDDEAKTIARMVPRTGAHLLDLSLPHGSKLDDGLVERILDRARSIGADRIVIVELPGLTTAPEDAIRARGFDLRIVDHHDYLDSGLDRRQRLSSLEQTAELLGYSLSPSEKIVAVNDRAFVPGLVELGLSKEGILEYSESTGNWKVRREVDRYVNLEPVETDIGKVYLLADPPGGMGAAVSALTIAKMPEPVNALLLFPNGSIQFSGNRAIVAELEKIVVPYAAAGTVRAHFKGGDPNRSMYWGAKDIDPLAREEILEKIAARLAVPMAVLRERDCANWLRSAEPEAPKEPGQPRESRNPRESWRPWEPETPGSGKPQESRKPWWRRF